MNLFRQNQISFLIQNDFVDFATTRNTGLEYIKNNIDCNLILLLDANDELVVTDKEKFRSQTKSTLCQVKLSTNEIEESTFLSPRLIRSDENHYYLFPIHEQLVNDLNLKYSSIPADSFFIKQKRDSEGQFEKTKQAIGWLFESYYKFKRIDGLFILVQHFHQTQSIILAFSLCQLCLSIKISTKLSFRS